MQALFDFLRELFGLFWAWGVVDEWERGLVVRFGKIVADVGPGWHPVIPVITELFVENIKSQAYNCNPQSVHVKHGNSSRTIAIQASGRYRIVDLRELFLTADDHERAIVNATEGLLLEFCEQHTWRELDGELVTAQVLPQLQEQFISWGIEIEALHIQSFCEHEAYRILGDATDGIALF